jgi:hypothetical protein
MNRKRTLARTLALDALVVVTLAACSSTLDRTKLAATWTEPGATPLHFKHMIVAFTTTDETLRRNVEDKLAAQIPNSTQSYKVMGMKVAQDSTLIRQHLNELGFDGALVMKVANVDAKVTYVPGNYWYGSPYSFGPYWGYAWGYPYDPGYVNVDQVVSVETQIFSLTTDKLIWAGRSETTNPKSAAKLANAVVDRVVRALHSDGLLVRAGCAANACQMVASIQ